MRRSTRGNQRIRYAALSLFVAAGLLYGCATSSTASTYIPLFTPTAAVTPTVELSTPLPARPIYAPGTLVDYISQDGDSLSAIAAHFNTNVDEILEANPLIPTTITTLQAGTAMKIPIYYKALWGSQFQIIPDSLFVNGPAQIGFNTRAFVNSHPGWLKYYSAFAGGLMRSGGDLIDYVAQTYSISPRLLLAIAEYQTGALSLPDMPANLEEYPLDYEEQYHKGFYLQLVWAATTLNNGYYGWRNGRLNAINRTDGTMEVPDPWQNAATVGIQYYYSQELSINAYSLAIYKEGLYQTYTNLFNDPWQNVQPNIPGNLTQDEMVLPFAAGKTWAYTGGPHSAWSSGEPYAALDFAPPTSVGGCAPSAEFTVAVADGLIVRTEEAVAILDLDKDGDERTGWVVLYLHLASNQMIQPGVMVQSGDIIGHPSCEGGSATGTHIHIARKYNGEWIDADSAVPFNLEGWIAGNGDAPYQGTLKRLGHVVTANELAAGNSAITAGY